LPAFQRDYQPQESLSSSGTRFAKGLLTAAGKAVIQATDQQQRFLSGPFTNHSGNNVNFPGGTKMFNNKMLVIFMLIAIFSLASAGCSDDNPVTPAANIDEAPLIPPTKLTVDFNKGKAMLKWGPSVDNRVVRYFVDREHDGVRTNLGKTDKSETTFVDENPPVGLNTYYVYATGTGSRQSAMISVSLMVTRPRRTANMHD
jgi:hypothetical protein